MSVSGEKILWHYGRTGKWIRLELRKRKDEILFNKSNLRG